MHQAALGGYPRWVRDRPGLGELLLSPDPSGNNGEVMLWLAIVPPLDRGTAWIDAVATGRSAEVRVRPPLCWK